MTLDDIRTALGTSDPQPVDALHAAVPHAAALAPEIYGLLDRVTRNSLLLPHEEHRMIHGLHVLAAAGQPDLYPYVVKLLRLDEIEHEEMFSIHAPEVLAKLMITTWDGDADSLFRMLEHADLSQVARWALFDTVARLTFDGRIPRSRTEAFLERYEAESLADDVESIWVAWSDTVIRLGFVALEPALQQRWDSDPVLDEEESQHRETSLAKLHHATAYPDDPSEFERDGLVAITDPVTALTWRTSLLELTASLREGLAADGVTEMNDPAADVRLDIDDVAWFERLLASKEVPEEALSFEGLDGFLHALVIGPEGPAPTLQSKHIDAIWGNETGPVWDSPEKQAYVEGLLHRHMAAIARRREAGGPFAPIIEDELFSGEAQGHLWADGFELGLELASEQWTRAFQNPYIHDAIWSIFDLAPDIINPETRPINDAKRKKILAQLPDLLLRIANFWKSGGASASGQQPVRVTKVGRNDPCPCGSGKKYKKCCGASGSGTLH